MARCGCTTGLCACAVVGADSDTVSTAVTGSGTVDSPYVVTSELIGDEPGGGCDCFALQWRASTLQGDVNEISLVADNANSLYLLWDEEPLVTTADSAAAVTRSAGGDTLSGFPPGAYIVSGDLYLFHLSGADTAQVSLDLPVSASLMGVFESGWPRGNPHINFSRTMYQADPWIIQFVGLTLSAPSPVTRAFSFNSVTLEVTKICGCDDSLIFAE
jgi:hypothetical protein